MSNNAPQIPRKPKLRSSCDGCGAAKVKCDRAVPKCGRCVSHGITCVYGVSQKMGKLPRHRTHSNSTRLSSGTAGTTNVDKLDRRSSRTSMVLDVGSFPSVTDMFAAWDTVDDNTNDLAMNLDKLEDWYSDLPELPIPNLTPLDSGDEVATNYYHNHLSSDNLQFGSIPTPESPNMRGYSSIKAPTGQPTSHESQYSKNSRHDGASMPSAAIADHDCHREAYNILESLHSLNLIKHHSISSSGTFLDSGTENPSDKVPLDHIIRLNRIASERLGLLLNCSCSRSPDLALLYGSIISLILSWYEKTSDCTWRSVDAVGPYVHTTGSTPSVGSGSEGGSPAWSITGASTYNTDGSSITSVPRQSTKLTIVPTKMTIGTFNVDDLSVQTALKMQLVSGEMRRAGHLIKQFAFSTSSRQCLDKGSPFVGVDSLHKSLDSWLVGEHLRITSIIRLRLKELNT